MTETPQATAASRRPRRIALYPVLLAASFVVELFAVSGVSPFSAIRALLVTIVATLLITLLATLLMRDRDRGGIVAALWALALLGGNDPRILALIVVATILMLVERYLPAAKASRIRWPRVGRAFEGLTVILAIAVGIQMVQTGAVLDLAHSVAYETPLRPGHPVAPATSLDPDVYVLLLDGHTRTDIVDSVFHGDGKGFAAALTAAGMTVVPHSRSNYTQTAESLPSLLEQRQLSDIPQFTDLLAGGGASSSAPILRRTINENATVAYLRGRGYEIDAVAPGYEQVSMREADRFVDTGQLNEFELAMLGRSIVGTALDALVPDAISAQQRGRILDGLETFATAPSWTGPGPQFVWAHIPSPHPPWVFHADGSGRSVPVAGEWLAETPASTGLATDELAAGYADQVRFLDARVVETIAELDRAIARRGRPAALVILSDHGSWIHADGGDIRLRFKNLIAARLPTGPADLPEDLTLVNLFRSLFAQLFGITADPQRDTQYQLSSGDRFHLVPVPDPEAAPTP